MNNLLDKKIREMSYDENQVLAFKGTGIGSYRPVDTRTDGNKYIVVKRTLRKMESDKYDIGTVESVVDRAFPGSLLKLNSRLIDNNPDILVVDRKPMQFRIDLPGMGDAAEFTVDEPIYRKVATGIENVLQKYRGGAIPARLTFKASMAHSESQLVTEFGLEMKDISKKLDLDFNAIFDKKSTVYIASFRQVFYTVCSDIPQNPSDVFADSVTWESLQEKGVDNNNPLGLVNQVGYGRAIYVKIESTEQSNLVDAALKASINEKLETTADVKYHEILKNSNFTAIVMGGGTRGHIDIISCKNIQEVIDIIKKNAQYSEENPAYPLFYNTTFLKDNRHARTIGTAEYIDTQCEVHEGGIIRLIHEGAYVAQFRVKWNEVIYDPNGNKRIEEKGWYKNVRNLTAYFSEEIYLNGNCENISIEAWGCTGLFWDWWRKSIDRKNVPLIPYRTFKISGTTLNQYYSVNPGL